MHKAWDLSRRLRHWSERSPSWDELGADEATTKPQEEELRAFGEVSQPYVAWGPYGGQPYVVGQPNSVSWSLPVPQGGKMKPPGPFVWPPCPNCDTKLKEESLEIPSDSATLEFSSLLQRQAMLTLISIMTSD